MARVRKTFLVPAALFLLIGGLAACGGMVAPMQLVFPEAIYRLDTDKKVIALVVDDGPHETGTDLILSALEKADICATFFMTGENLAQHPGLAWKVAKQGHKVANHFWEDRPGFQMSRTELEEALKRTREVWPLRDQPRLVRAGHALPSSNLIATAQDRGLRLVVGDLPAFDTLGLPQGVYRRYLMLVIRPGSIITFHNGRERAVNSARDIPLLVQAMRQRGYDFALIGDEGQPQPCAHVG